MYTTVVVVSPPPPITPRLKGSKPVFLFVFSNHLEALLHHSSPTSLFACVTFFVAIYRRTTLTAFSKQQCKSIELE